jgi:hypothetical protein
LLLALQAVQKQVEVAELVANNVPDDFLGREIKLEEQVEHAHDVVATLAVTHDTIGVGGRRSLHLR